MYGSRADSIGVMFLTMSVTRKVTVFHTPFSSRMDPGLFCGLAHVNGKHGVKIMYLFVGSVCTDSTRTCHIASSAKN